MHLFSYVSARECNRFENQFRRYLDPDIPAGYPGREPGFSLGRLMVRLLKNQVRNIRLLGVDLFTPEYYWTQSQDYYWLAELRTRPEGLLHSTNEPWRPWKAVSFLEFLLGMQEEVGFNIKIRKASGTASFMDTFE